MLMVSYQVQSAVRISCYLRWWEGFWIKFDEQEYLGDYVYEKHHNVSKMKFQLVFEKSRGGRGVGGVLPSNCIKEMCCWDGWGGTIWLVIIGLHFLYRVTCFTFHLKNVSVDKRMTYLKVSTLILITYTGHRQEFQPKLTFRAWALRQRER